MQKVISSDQFAGPVSETRAASIAGGGTALTTTAAIIPIPNGTTHVSINPRNFTTAVVAKLAINPYLYILRSDNSLGTTVESSVQGQQVGGTGISLNAFDVKLNGGMLYIGSHVPWRGIKVAMSASVNSNASTLLVEYWNGVWTSLAATDGTAAGGATFGQSGNVTWTVPTDWIVEFPLNTAQPPVIQPAQISLQHQMVHSYKKRFWTRWSVSAQLSATVLVNTMFPFNRSTAYAELTEGSFFQFRTDKAEEGASCVEMLTDAGTANAIVNCHIASPFGMF